MRFSGCTHQCFSSIKRDLQNNGTGGSHTPKGLHSPYIIIFIHHDPGYWGEHAHQSKPERFSGSISKASKDQVAFFLFVWHPQVCIDQSSAMIETKMGLSMTPQHF